MRWSSPVRAKSSLGYRLPTGIRCTIAVFLRLRASDTGMNRPVSARRPTSRVFGFLRRLAIPSPFSGASACRVAYVTTPLCHEQGIAVNSSSYSCSSGLDFTYLNEMIEDDMMDTVAAAMEESLQ